MPIDEPVTRADEVWAARRVIRQHEESSSPARATGRCAQCRDDGDCWMLAWARTIVGAEQATAD